MPEAGRSSVTSAVAIALAAAVAWSVEGLPASRDSEPYVVTADRVDLEMIGEMSVTHLMGNVTLTHGEAVLTGDEATVYEENSLALMQGNVTLVDQGVVFTGQRGAYARVERRAELVDHVVVVDEEKTITADRITYLRNSRLASAGGDVCIVYTERETTICGGHGTYNFSTDHGTMDRDPKMVIAKERPTVIESSRLEVFDREDIAVATGDVVVIREGIEATCSELTYFASEERAVLLGQPVVTEGANWIRGDEIELIFSDNVLTEAHVTGSARGFNLDDSGGTNEVEGESITVRFEGESATEMIVEGGARGSYRLPRAGQGEEDRPEEGTPREDGAGDEQDQEEGREGRPREDQGKEK
jgi:lipopolysaccharide export system protein LptA